MALEYPSKRRDVVELAILSSADSSRHEAVDGHAADSSISTEYKKSGRTSSVPTIAFKNDVGGEKLQEIEYPGPMKLFFITLALCLAVFLVALDQTIIATVSGRCYVERCH
jgi:hypothetical protein